MGVASINVFLVHLELMPNFHSKNSATFHLIFAMEIRQCFTSNASQCTKCYSHQVFDVKKWQWGCLIFTEKIRQSFAFGVLWCTGRVLRLCIWCISTCSYCDEPKPSKASSILMRVTYTRKPMSLRWLGSRQSHYDDRAHNIAWICTYNNRLKCIPTLQGHEHSWSTRVTCITTRVQHIECTITHTHASIYIYIYIHTYIHHAHCYHTN